MGLTPEEDRSESNRYGSIEIIASGFIQIIFTVVFSKAALLIR
jgi:hypothetical protein